MERGETMYMRLLVAVTAVVVLCASAWAYPTVLGPSGIVQTPNTDTTDEGVVECAVDRLAMDEDITTIAVRLNAGLTDKAELGIAYLKVGDGLDGRVVNFSGKLAVQKEPDYPFGLAAGFEFGDLGEDLFEARGIEKALRLYAVASKMLTPSADEAEEPVTTDIRGQVGIAFTRVENGGREDSIRPFLGVEFATPRGTVAGVEWRSEEFGDDVVSAVVRHPFGRAAFAQIGLTKNPAGLGIGDETSFFVGLGWRFKAPE